jgi:hypothetical protein
MVVLFNCLNKLTKHRQKLYILKFTLVIPSFASHRRDYLHESDLDFDQQKVVWQK